MAKPFFNEATDQSQVKSAIVAKYFAAWANAIKRTVRRRGNRLAYLDLFAGPGRYEDGTVSTPLRVLEYAIADSDLRQMLVTVFNDKDEQNCRALETAIAGLAGVDSLKYAPMVRNNEIGTDIVTQFESMKFVPTLFFVDPWGYKGLSLRLINSVLKDWGCECIFFFNYNRVNMGLSNVAVKEHMDALFGEDRAEQIRPRLEAFPPEQRELAIVQAICDALQEMGGKYVLPFRFKRPDGVRTSHHLVFVSKHPLGYKIMKEVMARESSGAEQGVPTFEYNPSFGRQGLLFELARPLDDLADMLLDEFAGRSLTMEQIYETHNYGRRFVESNYKEVLKMLEAEGRIACTPSASGRPKNTFAKHVRVAFPPKA